MAVSELAKVAREDPDAIEVLQVLGNLLREAGQVERAIQVHQGLLARPDLTRAERAHGLAALGADFRKAGFLDRATRTFEEVLAVDAKNIHALIGLQKLQEDQRHWREAYEIQTRLSRLRKTDDSLVLGHLQAAMGQEAIQAGREEEAEKAFRTALSLDRRVFPAHLGLADLAAQDRRRARGGPARGGDPDRPRARVSRLRPAGPALRRGRRAGALRRPLRAHHRAGPAGLAGAAAPRPPRARGGAARGEPRAPAPRAGVEPAGAAAAPRDLAHARRAGGSSGEVADYVRTAESAVSPGTPTCAPPAVIARTTCCGGARTATSGGPSSRSASASPPRRTDGEGAPRRPRPRRRPPPPSPPTSSPAFPPRARCAGSPPRIPASPP